MKKVLEDLYFGEIQPSIRINSGNPHLQKAEQVVSSNEELLIKLLEGKGKKLFLDFIDAQSEVDGASSYESFAFGFKLGARIILEAVVEI